MKIINKILYKELRPHLLAMALILILVFLAVGFEALAPWPFKILIDNVLGNEVLDPNSIQGKIFSFFTSRESLGFFAVLVFGISSMSVSVTEYFAGIATRKLSNSIINGFAQKAFNNLEQLAIGFYKQQEIGDYIYRLSYDVAALGNMLEAGILPAVTHLLYFLTTIAIMFIISAKLALLALGILPVLAVSLWIFNKHIGAASKASEYSNSALFSFIHEVLSQLKIIQAFNQEPKESKIFGQKQETSLVRELNVYGLSFLLNLLIGIVIAIGYSLVIAQGIKLVFLGTMSTGLLIIFLFYLDNLTNPLLSFLTAATTLKQDYVKVSRMSEFFTPKFKTHDSGVVTSLSNLEIVFEKVSVYGDEGAVILKDISFKIPAGKKTVIVGASGSGKTTIASLILRFIEPTSGKILIGSKDIKQYSLQSLRDVIAYVPQEIVLFDDTIRENIAFGNPNSSVSDIKRAAELAVAEKFIAHLPNNYEFVVGEEGLNLSGGQRQRLMLARAFIKRNAKIVILDEPLSSLDVKTRAILMNNIRDFAVGKTAIIISNILEVVNQADYVIVVNAGELLHIGDTKSLLKESRLANLILDSA